MFCFRNFLCELNTGGSAPTTTPMRPIILVLQLMVCLKMQWGSGSTLRSHFSTPPIAPALASEPLKLFMLNNRHSLIAGSIGKNF